MSKAGLTTLESGLRVVEMLLVEETVTVDEIRDRLDMSRSSAYRLIRTLAEAGWVDERVRGKYQLDASLGLTVRAMRGPSIRDVAAPFLHQLAAIFTETVTLSVRSGMRRVPIDQILSTREVFMRVELGRSWPLYAGGSGRAILAAMDRRAQLRYLDTESLTPLTAGTVVNPQQLLAVLATDRERGYSTSCGERDSDAFSVAAAFTVDGRVAGSIAVCGPAGRYNEELAARIGSQVTEKARLLSESLSGVADE